MTASLPLPPRAVLFDLDGTLVDSFVGIASAYHKTLAHLGLADMDDDELKAFVGPPVQEVLIDHFGLSGDRLQEAIHTFRTYYGDDGLFRFTEYAGVEEMLIALRSEGFDLYVATSKLQTMAIKVIGRAGWSDLFTFIGGAAPDGSRHLKKDVVEFTARNVSDNARIVAMVGDRAQDLDAAREVGLPAVGVTWGYGSVAELSAASPTAMAYTPEGLHSTLVRLRDRDS